jgi:hypothetical protein
MSPPAYINLNGNQISVNPALTTQADVGNHTITLKVDSLEYSGTVTSGFYTFVLTVSPCVVNTYTIASIPDSTYIINQGAMTINFSPGLWSNLACLYTQMHTASIKVNNTTVSPTFISF